MVKLPRLALCLLLAPAGCGTGDATVEAKVVEASATEYVIEVKTMPGLMVGISGVEKEADSSGIARLTVPVSSLSYLGDMVHVSVMASGRSGLSKYVGTSEVRLPFSPNDAKKRPTASHWIQIKGGGDNQVSGGSLWSFGDAGAALMSSDGSITVRLLAPIKSTVTLAGKSVTTDAVGAGEVSFTTDETLGLISSAAIIKGFGGSEAEPVEATVALPGGSPEKVALSAKWMGVSGELLKPRLTSVSTKPIPGTRSGAALSIYLDSRNKLHSAGREGRLSTMDLVAIGTAQPEKKMSDCDGYELVNKEGKSMGGGTFALPRVGIDEEVVVFDAHTGKEVGRQVFAADDFCPVQKRTSESTLKVYPNDDKVLAWLGTL